MIRLIEFSTTDEDLEVQNEEQVTWKRSAAAQRALSLFASGIELSTNIDHQTRRSES